LYNAALAERKDAYKQHERTVLYENERGQCIVAHMQANLKVRDVSSFEQIRELVDIKDVREEYRDIASHVLQNVILRVDRAYQGFFRRVKNGEKAGYPRFKGRNQYDSFTYPDRAGWKLTVDDQKNNKDEKYQKYKAPLHLSKIGTVKVILHRAIKGTIKTLTIKRENNHWYAVFTCEVADKPLPVSSQEVGIDLGVTHFAALSDGTFIEHPRYFRRAEKKLARAQQSVACKKKGSHRRAKAVQRVAKCHRKIRNQRRDFHHKASRKLVNQHQVIVLENLQVKNLTKAPAPKQDEQGNYLPNGASAKAGLTKSILDAGWATFTEMISFKAASAGRTLLLVNPFMTSQRCSGCGTVVKKDLSERWHSCSCGTELDRDTNAAINILNLGKQQFLGGTRPTPSKA
jgi:putative transposase